MSSLTFGGLTKRPAVNLVYMMKPVMLVQLTDLGECYERVVQRGIACFQAGVLMEFVLWRTDEFVNFHTPTTGKPLTAFWSYPELDGAYVVDLEIDSPQDGPMVARFKLVEAHVVFENNPTPLQKRVGTVASAFIMRHLADTIDYAVTVKQLGIQLSGRFPTCDEAAHVYYDCCSRHQALKAKQLKKAEMLLVLDAFLGIGGKTFGDIQLSNHCGIKAPSLPSIGSPNWWKIVESGLEITVPAILTSV